MTLGWIGDIEKLSVENDTFRTVIHTGKHSQLTVMSILPGEDIGNEIHHDNDQFLRIEQGEARVTFGRSHGNIDEEHTVASGWAIIIPAGIWHNVINRGARELKLYSIYSPAHHPDGTVQATKAEAMAAEATPAA